MSCGPRPVVSTRGCRAVRGGARGPRDRREPAEYLDAGVGTARVAAAARVVAVPARRALGARALGVAVGRVGPPRAWARSSGRRAGRGGGPSWGPCGPRTSGQWSNGPSWARMPCWAWVCSPVFRHRSDGDRHVFEPMAKAAEQDEPRTRWSVTVVRGGRFDLGVTGAPGGMGRRRTLRFRRTRPCVRAPRWTTQSTSGAASPRLTT